MAEMQAVYEEYAVPVYRYLLGLCGNAQDAEELCAETFYQAVRSIHRYDGSCKLLTWLCQIAKHSWYKELARRRHKTLPLEAADGAEGRMAGPEAAAEDVEARLALYRGMQALDEKTREVMYLRLTGELSFGQIAEVLGKTETWARVTFYRGKERLKNGQEN